MDELIQFLPAIVPALAIAFVMPLLVKRQRAAIAKILPMLQSKGGMTLNEVSDELKIAFWQKGYVMNALDQMVAEGKLRKEPPPEGTPRMQIFKLTKYVVF